LRECNTNARKWRLWVSHHYRRNGKIDPPLQGGRFAVKIGNAVTNWRALMNNIFVLRKRAMAFILTLALAGCGPKISPENFDKIVKGMKEDHVAKILGIASESRNSAVKVEGTTFTSTQSKWRNDKGTIVVLFQDGEVQAKHYYAPGAEPAPERRY
jgi:hypothetical protein